MLRQPAIGRSRPSEPVLKIVNDKLDPRSRKPSGSLMTLIVNPGRVDHRLIERRLREISVTPPAFVERSVIRGTYVINDPLNIAFAAQP